MCGPCICSRCDKSFTNSIEFDQHSCCVEAAKLPRLELLKRLYESGGCSKEYYESQLKREGK